MALRRAGDARQRGGAGPSEPGSNPRGPSSAHGPQVGGFGYQFCAVCSQGQNQLGSGVLFIGLLLTHPSPDPIALHFAARPREVWGMGEAWVGRLDRGQPVKQWTRVLECSALLPDVFLSSLLPPSPSLC